MPKIDWTKPIETEKGTPLKLLKMYAGGTEMAEVQFPDGGISWSSLDGNLGDSGWVRNVQAAETLFVDPLPDNFQTESPIRAFTHWDAQAEYAIGRGFRPSLQHLARYLDAMISKEGWELVQILESATSAPSFVFRRG